MSHILVSHAFSYTTLSYNTLSYISYTTSATALFFLSIVFFKISQVCAHKIAHFSLFYAYNAYATEYGATLLDLRGYGTN